MLLTVVATAASLSRTIGIAIATAVCLGAEADD